MRLIIRSLVVASVCAFAALSQAQFKQAWSKLYDSNVSSSYDLPSAICRDSAGNVFSGGTSTNVTGTDFLIINYNSVGGVVWTARVDVTLQDNLTAMTIDGAGDLYLVGTISNGSGAELYTFKLSGTNGGVIWHQTYIDQYGGVYPKSIVLDSNDDVYVAAEEQDVDGLYDVTLIKYAFLDGAPQWSRTIDGGAGLNDAPRKVVVDGSDNVVVLAGTAASATNANIWVLKYNGAGTLLWQAKWDSNTGPNSRDGGNDISIGAADNVYVCGNVRSGAIDDALLLSYDSSGNLAWAHTWDGGFGHDSYNSTTFELQGTVYVGGLTKNSAGNMDALFAAYDKTGAKLWTTIYDGPAAGDDGALKVDFDWDHQVIALVGQHGVGSDYDLGVLKIKPATGVITQKISYNGPLGGLDDPVDMTLGGYGDVCVVGSQNSQSQYYDFETVRFQQYPEPAADSYSTTEGQLLTVPIQNGVEVNDHYANFGTYNQSAGANHGQLMLANDGSFTYQPNAGFYGTDTFTYTVTRDGLTSPPAIVTLTVNPIAIKTFTISPNSVYGGFSTTGTVTLASAAPVGGLDVTISDNSSAITTPPSLHFNSGATQGNFIISTSNVAAVSVRTVTVSHGGASKTANLTINPYPVLQSLAIYPDVVVGGNQTFGKVTLSLPAPVGGVMVTLTDNSGSITTPPSVTVLTNSTMATFPIGTSAVGVSATRTVTASLNGISKMANLTLNPVGIASLAINPSTIKGGLTTTGTVTLDGPAPAGGITVTLTDNSSAVSEPPSTFIPAGQVTGNFTIHTSAVAQVSVRSVSATYAGVTKSAAITLTP